MEKQGIRKPEFYKKTGLSNGFLDKNENISSQNIEIIISVFPEISLDWLITGEGEMLRSEGNDQSASSISVAEIELLRSAIRDKEMIIEGQNKNIKLLEEKVEFLEEKLTKCKDKVAHIIPGKQGR